MIEEEVATFYKSKKSEGSTLEDNWNTLLSYYKTKYPEEAYELIRRIEGKLPSNFDQLLESQVPFYSADVRYTYIYTYIHTYMYIRIYV